MLYPEAGEKRHSLVQAWQRDGRSEVFEGVDYALLLALVFEGYREPLRGFSEGVGVDLYQFDRRPGRVPLEGQCVLKDPADVSGELGARGALRGRVVFFVEE